MPNPVLHVRLRRRASRGFTLLEMVIVVALVAILAMGVLSGSGVVGTAQERAASAMILAGIRVGMTRANADGLPVRLVIDLDQSRVSLEQTRSRMLRVKIDEKSESAAAGAAAATEAERLAEQDAKRILEGPREPLPLFKPVTKDGDEISEFGAGRALGGKVRFVSVQTEHDPVPRTQGRAYLYFWPGGSTEKAVITFGRPEEDAEPRTVVVNALTGRASVVKGAVDLQEPEIEVDFGERAVE
jgi:general secretion pathway protein H